MKRHLISILLLFVLGACVPTELTPDQIEREKEQVHKQIKKILKGYDEKDLKTILSTFSTSQDLMAFGSDAGEVMRSLSDWEAQMAYDFQLYESSKFGEMQNLSIQVSKTGDLAAAVFESKAEIVTGGVPSSMLWRFSTALKKEDGMWRIIHWVASVATEGESAREVVEKKIRSSLK